MAPLPLLQRILWVVLLAAPGLLRGDYTTTQQSLTVTNYTNYVIDADATKLGAPGRSVIVGSVSLKYKRTGVIAFPDGVDFTLTWSLVDAAGTPHPLDTGGTSVDSTQAVAWSGGVTEVTLTSTINLNPASRLDISKQYRVRVTATPAFGGTATTYTEASGRPYGHFTNTVSDDAAFNVIGLPTFASIDRSWVIISPGVNGPTLSGGLALARYDDFNLAMANADIPVRLRAVMNDVTNPGAPVPVPIVTPSATHLQSMANHSLLGDNPATVQPTFTLVLLPQALNRNAMYQTTAIFEYQEADGSYVSLGQVDTAPQRIFPMTGKLWFGDVLTRITDLTEAPASIGPNWLMTIPADKAYVDGHSGLTFGGMYVVSINEAGDATVLSGTANVNTAAPDTDTAAHVRFKRESLTLSANGARANITVYLPAGFTACVPDQVVAPATVPVLEKNASGKAVLLDQPLNSSLRPPTPLTLTPLSVRRGAHPDAGTAHTEFYCSHEKLPATFKASSIQWSQGGLPDEVSTFVVTPSGAGEWRSVRDHEMAVVESLHAPPEGELPLLTRDTRPSNDSYLRRVHETAMGDSRSFGIKVTASGVALLSASVPIAVPLSTSHANPHYPQGTGEPANSGFDFTGGLIEINDNVVNPATSRLTGVANLKQRYEVNPQVTTCNEGNPLAADQGSFNLHPAGGVLRFTDDLGLIGEGTLDAVTFSWGTIDKAGPNVNGHPTYRFAHTVLTNFTKGTFYQPGIHLAGTVPALNNDCRPGTLLLLGREKPGDTFYVERPLANNVEYYHDGLANYAGMNLRVSAEPAPGAMQAKSLVAGQELGPYPLKARDKYYVQLSGVTGMHERQTTLNPVTVRVFGFPTSFDDFKFAYLDNKVRNSITKGSVNVPFPVGVLQPFESLVINERGQPTDAQMPSGPQNHDLDYWGFVPFTAHSIAFRPQLAVTACDVPPVEKGIIEMGASFSNLGSGIIPGTVTASLGFKAIGDAPSIRGELVTLADSASGGAAPNSKIDSRIHLPGNLTVTVPSGGSYTLNPTTKACFNDSNGASSNSHDGFLSFAGNLDVKFFTAMPVHVHLQPSLASAGIYFMPGWSENGETFFSNPGSFDSAHRGYPPVAQNFDLLSYRTPPDLGNDNFRLHAKKTWLDVVDFDFPLAWDPNSHRFASSRPLSSDLLLFNLKNQLRSLTGNGAELEFGAEIEGLPQFNPLRLVLEKVDGVTAGAFSTFDTALKQASSNALDATHITDAVQSIDELITSRVDKVLEAALSPALDGFLDPAFQAAEAAAAFEVDPEAQRQAFVQTLTAQLGVEANLKAAVKHAIGGRDVEGLVQRIAGANGNIKKVLDGVTTLQAIITPGGNGKRAIFRNLTDKLASGNGAGYLLIKGTSGYLANKLDQLDSGQDSPFFDELGKILLQAQQTLTQVTNGADTLLATPLKNFVDSPQNDIMGGLPVQIDQTMASFLPSGASSLRDIAGPLPGQFRAAKFRTAIRRVIMDKVQTSLLGGRIQTLMRQTFSPVRGRIRDGMDHLVNQITTTVKDAFLDQLSAGGNAPGNPLRNLAAADSGLRTMENFFQGAHLRGYARTVDNSIAELRLDGGIKFAPPGMGNGMEFSGYFTFRDNHVTGPTPEGLDAGSFPGAKVEVSAGANLGSRSRPLPNTAPGQDADKTTSFFDNMGVGADLHFGIADNGTPVGFKGNLDLRGNIDFGIVSLEHIGLTANFSALNQYVIGSTEGHIIQIIKANVDIFAGHARMLSQTGVINDRLSQALLDQRYHNQNINADNLAGVVCRIKGEISMNELVRRISSFNLDEDIAEVTFNKETIYAYLLRPPQQGEYPHFVLGYSEGGKLKARAAKTFDLAEAEASFAGVAEIPLSLQQLALSVVGLGLLPDGVAFSGGAHLNGPVGGFPKLNFGLKGFLYRGGMKIDPPEFDLSGIPVKIEIPDSLDDLF